MFKRIALFFVVFFASIYIGLKIVNDNGYLLMVYDKWTIEMPLWCFAIVALITLFVFHYSLLFFAWLGSLSSRITNWWLHKRELKAHDLTTRGLIEFIQGNWVSAEKKLIAGAKREDFPLTNYLMAAKAAQHQGDFQRRDRYFKKAESRLPNAVFALRLSQAELQVANKEWDNAERLLTPLHTENRKHPQVLRLLLEVYRAKKSWEALIALLPSFKKYPVYTENDYETFAASIYAASLKSLFDSSDTSLFLAQYKELPSAIRQHPMVVAVYAEGLEKMGDKEKAEAVLWHTLSRRYDDQLMYLYGKYIVDPGRQLRQAETWLKTYANNPILLLTLGRLSQADQLWGKARTYLEMSLALSKQAETYFELAELYTRMGLADKGHAVHRQGLQSILSRD